MFYDESKDQSERFGWKKVCDEHQPTEEEQLYWGKILIGFAAVMGSIAIFL